MLKIISFIFCDFLENEFVLLMAALFECFGDFEFRNSFRFSNFGFFWKKRDFCGLICTCNAFRNFLATSISEIHFRFSDFGFFENFLAFSEKSPLETLEIVSFEHILKEDQRFFDK